MSELTHDLAERWARLALDNVRRELPNATQHVTTVDDRDVRPRTLHPAFYGSFDWHSCVHMHWLLVRLLRLVPHLDCADEIRTTLDAHLSPDNLAAEAAYLTAHPSFERPYGWGWALQLAAELDEFPAWHGAAQPLADTVVQRFLDWIPRAAYPVRHGVHSNSAFGLLLALRHGDERLVPVIGAATRRWFGTDRDYPAHYEPSGEDFLSPALVEAALVSRVLNADEFPAWFASFLPELPRTLLEPVLVTDRSDYRIVHLDGLQLSRAWCFGMLAERLSGRVADTLTEARERHLGAALPHVASGDYGGDHWLASFALLALTG